MQTSQMEQAQNTIKSLDQYIEALHNTIDKGAFCFRGQVNHAWEALPSLLRKPRLEAIRLQTMLMRELLAAPTTLPYLRNQDPVEYLMLLQHFGIPTKLLDVSMDPLIALFFACNDASGEYKNENGKVYIFNLEQYNKLKINTPELDVYKKGISTQNYEELLIKRIEHKEHLFFEPLIKNPRMRIQDGAFFLFSTYTTEGNDTCLSMEAFHCALNNHRRSKNNDNLLWYAHRIIDKDHKEQILRELDFQFGINESMVNIDSDTIRSVEQFYKDLNKRSVHYYESTLKERFDTPLDISNRA